MRALTLLDRRPVAYPACPLCDEPLRPARSRTNHDRPGFAYFRCDDCGHEQGYVIEIESEAA